MGKSDVYQFDYLDDNGRFADQVNGALFKGEQVVKPEELEPADAQAVYLGKEAGARREFRSVVDKARMWRGRLLHILAVENQAYVDYHMVLRNMLSESLSYQKQWKQKKRAHEREKDLKAGTDAFLSGMEEGMENGMEKGIKRGMEEGIEKGKALQLIEYVCKKLLKNKPAEVIADELEEDLGVVEHIVEIQRRMGNYDVNEIFRMLQENA